MYHFSYFKEPDRARILALMAQHPFGMLLGASASGSPVATQVPMLHTVHDDELWVRGHMMRNTDHHKAFQENPQALAVFHGPHAYVSANWYSQPGTASTWNYMSVHVRGPLRFLDDPELVALMRELTLHFEGGNEASPTVYDQLPEAFLQKMMPAIVGFEIRAEKLDNVFKLSQNRDPESYSNIITQLRNQGGDAEHIAREMELRTGELFSTDGPWDPGRFDFGTAENSGD